MDSSAAHVLIARCCVNDCVFCTVADQRRRREFPSRENVLSFIDKARRDGVRNMVFSGMGEPTLDPHIEEYLQRAHEHGFPRISVFTNGFGATPEKVARWCGFGITDVLISVHGLEAGHDHNVGRSGSWREGMDAIRMYADAGARVSVNTCLTRSNLHEIPELCRQMQALPIWMQTLAFLEWSGNVLLHPEEAPDYAEIALRAHHMITPENRKTYFDNIPFCVVRRRTNEQQGMRDVRLLSGEDVLDLAPRDGKLLLGACTERRCPLLSVCPGFEKRYVAARGWQDLPQRVEDFLTEIADPERRQALLGPPPRVKAADRPAAGAASDPTTEDQRQMVVVVKTTSSCNAACTYCSSHRDAATPAVEMALVERMYDEVGRLARARATPRVTFLWHGGEPLLLGREFYEAVWERGCAVDGPRFQHLIQSNLLLFDEAWADLLRRHDVAISTSVDPFGEERRQTDGSLQFPDWMDRFAAACEANVRVGIVFTATPRHLGRADEVYAFFRNLQGFASRPVGIRVNPLYPEGRARDLAQGTELFEASDFGAFLAELARAWEDDGRPFPLSPVQEWVQGGGRSCEFSGTCHDAFMAVNGAGDVFHCGRFADSAFPWGNIFRQDLEAILAHPSRAEFEQRTRVLRDGPCRDCEHWARCRGGCPYHAFLGAGTVLEKTPYCEAYRQVLSRVAPSDSGHPKRSARS